MRRQYPATLRHPDSDPGDIELASRFVQGQPAPMNLS